MLCLHVREWAVNYWEMDVGMNVEEACSRKAGSWSLFQILVLVIDLWLKGLLHPCEQQCFYEGSAKWGKFVPWKLQIQMVSQERTDIVCWTHEVNCYCPSNRKFKTSWGCSFKSQAERNMNVSKLKPNTIFLCFLSVFPNSKVGSGDAQGSLRGIQRSLAKKK